MKDDVSSLPKPEVETGDAAAERSLAQDLRQLVDDGRALAEAELAYQKSRAALAGSHARTIAILAGLAAALMFCALLALTVGLVWSLTPLLTAWGATGAVAGGLLLAGLACAFAAGASWRRMARRLIDRGTAE